MKYKQKIIPEVSSKDWINLAAKEVRNKMFEYYKQNISGKDVINLDKNYRILFRNKPGGRKVSFGGKMYEEKAEIIKIIVELLKYAEYSNFGDRKLTDKDYVVGYLNFKAKAKINGILHFLRIAVQLRKDGNLYYNHEINIYIL